MAWHRGWPGLLALCASDDPAEPQEALKLLKQDWGALQQAKALAGASPWHSKAVARSALSTTLMVE
eukprot:2940187-Lingulodinium_polyedra.AAC.1